MRDFHQIDNNQSNPCNLSSLYLYHLRTLRESARGRNEDPLLDTSIVREPGLATAEVSVNLGSAHATLTEKHSMVR